MNTISAFFKKGQTIHYLKEAITFFRENKKLFYIFLFLYLLEFFISLFKVLPTDLLQLILIFIASIYIYAVPTLFLRRQQGENIKFKLILEMLGSYLKRLFFPFVLFFLVVFAISYVPIVSIFHIQLVQTKNYHGIGFYPFNALIDVIGDIIFSFFLFSPLLYSLARQNFFDALKNSISLTIKNISFMLPFMLWDIMFTFFQTLFVPLGNYPLRFILLIIDTTFSFLVVIALFLYYQKHYKILPLVVSDESPPTFVPVNVVYRRMFAALADIVLLIISFFIAVNYFFEYVGKKSHGVYTVKEGSVIIPLLLFFVAEFLFIVLLEWLTGKSPGKVLFGIKVYRENGKKIALWQSFVRNILRLLDAFPFIIPYLLGLIILAGSDKKQRIGDKVAHTLVSK